MLAFFSSIALLQYPKHPEPEFYLEWISSLFHAADFDPAPVSLKAREDDGIWLLSSGD
jgi:hypothetical protein